MEENKQTFKKRIISLLKMATEEKEEVVATEKVELETEEQVPEANVVESISAEVEELKGAMTALTEAVAKLQETVGSMATQGQELAEVKEKLSAIETHPADEKINLNAQNKELSIAQKRFQAYQEFKK